MNRSIEAIPTWSLCYIINGDARDWQTRKSVWWTEAMHQEQYWDSKSKIQRGHVHRTLLQPLSVLRTAYRSWGTATSSITSNNPFNNIRYEHYRIFQENHTSLFGGACYGGRTFAAKYDNPDKNIDDCVTYILNWVQKSGCNGFLRWRDIWASHPLLRGEGTSRLENHWTAKRLLTTTSNSQRRRRHRQDRKPSANISKSRWTRCVTEIPPSAPHRERTTKYINHHYSTMLWNQERNIRSKS